jgi:ABC-type glycerol-3-phosphate transport system permease component
MEQMNITSAEAAVQAQMGASAQPRRRRRRALRLAIGSFLTLYSLITLVPFYFLFIRAFVPTKDVTELHLWIPEPDQITMDGKFGNLATFYRFDVDAFKEAMGISGYVNPSFTLREIAQEFNVPEERIAGYLQNYITYNGFYTIFGGGRFLSHLLGTVFVVVVSIALGGLLGLMTGSVLAGFRRRWHLWVYYLYLFQIAISPIMIILPTYLIITRYLGLYDNYMALVLLYIKGGALSTMVFTSYVATIPKDLRESVEVDGGNHWHYFRYILLPLAKTPFAVFAAISLPVFWNDLLYGFLFLSPDNFTIIPLINAFNGTFATNLQATYAGLLMATVPLLIVYLVFQRLFVRSALAGAIKG